MPSPSNSEPPFVRILQEAASALDTSPPADPDAATRRDLTGHHVVTIDDASTTEIDDGAPEPRISDVLLSNFSCRTRALLPKRASSCCKLDTRHHHDLLQG